MTLIARVLLALLTLLATMFLANCGGSYGCRVTFGASTCTPSGSGIGSGGSGGGGGGGGGGSATAFAFAVDQGGTVDGYTLNATAGTFQFTSGITAPTIPASDPGAGMVTAQKQFVYSVFELENAIYGWSVNSSGALTLLSGFPATLSLSTPPVAFNQYSLATNPAGTLLFVSNTFANEILVFQISTTGALTAVGSPFPTPVEPGNLTTDGLGKYLYVAENVSSSHTGTEVLAYVINAGTGALAAVPGSPFAFPMWQLQGDASGNYLIGTTGNVQFLSGSDDKNLYVFSITPSGANAGAISAVSGSPFPTANSPFNIAVQPASASSGEEFVYSFSINDTDTGYNPIEGFQLNTTNGTLTAISGFPTTGIATGHWGQFDQSGANLFVYSSISNGTTILTQLGALSIGSNGIPTEPTSPASFATPGYWVVTDPQ